MKHVLAILLAPFVVGACTGDGGEGQVRTSGAQLTGAGATFPYPLYARWFSDYARQTGVRINYQSIGSGGGIRQLIEGTVDFAASDSPMTDEELSRARGPVMHIPTVMGAVAITYNLAGVAQPLRFTGDVIADIYLAKIRRWNDTRISGLNPGVALPSQDILVVQRSDGSGTTYIFTDYLAAVSPAWASGPGRGKDVRWPVGLGAKGNEGVTGQVRQTPGSIGYVELAYAHQNRLPTAHARNAAGRFVAPSIESVTAAAAGVLSTLPPDTDYRISIVNAPGEETYAISSFTWILVYRDQLSTPRGRQLVQFLRWALTEGEKQAADLDYAPLPEEMAQRLLARIDSVAQAPAAGGQTN